MIEHEIITRLRSLFEGQGERFKQENIVKESSAGFSNDARDDIRYGYDLPAWLRTLGIRDEQRTESLVKWFKAGEKVALFHLDDFLFSEQERERLFGEIDGPIMGHGSELTLKVSVQAEKLASSVPIWRRFASRRLAATLAQQLEIGARRESVVDALVVALRPVARRLPAETAALVVAARAALETERPGANAGYYKTRGALADLLSDDETPSSRFLRAALYDEILRELRDRVVPTSGDWLEVIESCANNFAASLAHEDLAYDDAAIIAAAQQALLLSVAAGLARSDPQDATRPVGGNASGNTPQDTPASHVNEPWRAFLGDWQPDAPVLAAAVIDRLANVPGMLRGLLREQTAPGAIEVRKVETGTKRETTRETTHWVRGKSVRSRFNGWAIREPAGFRREGAGLAASPVSAESASSGHFANVDGKLADSPELVGQITVAFFVAFAAACRALRPDNDRKRDADIASTLFNAGVNLRKAGEAGLAGSELAPARAAFNAAGLWWVLHRQAGVPGGLRRALHGQHGIDCAVNLFGALTELPAAKNNPELLHRLAGILWAERNADNATDYQRIRMSLIELEIEAPGDANAQAESPIDAAVAAEAVSALVEATLPAPWQARWRALVDQPGAATLAAWVAGVLGAVLGEARFAVYARAAAAWLQTLPRDSARWCQTLLAAWPDAPLPQLAPAVARLAAALAAPPDLPEALRRLGEEVGASGASGKPGTPGKPRRPTPY